MEECVGAAFTKHHGAAEQTDKRHSTLTPCARSGPLRSVPVPKPAPRLQQTCKCTLFVCTLPLRPPAGVPSENRMSHCFLVSWGTPLLWDGQGPRQRYLQERLPCSAPPSKGSHAIRSMQDSSGCQCEKPPHPSWSRGEMSDL